MMALTPAPGRAQAAGDAVLRDPGSQTATTASAYREWARGPTTFAPTAPGSENSLNFPAAPNRDTGDGKPAAPESDRRSASPATQSGVEGGARPVTRSGTLLHLTQLPASRRGEGGAPPAATPAGPGGKNGGNAITPPDSGPGDGTPTAPGKGEAAAPARGETVDQAICRLIDAAAAKEGLPASFLTRLIWRESSFRPDVVSHKGAQGIAQFMPGTARERGLDNPFDPEAAIPASAALLADLNRKFGNLGLAAAAYNAGPGRVNGFLAGGGLPNETRTYVRLITGRPAEDWAALRKQGAAPDAPPPFPAEPCLVTVASLRKGAPPPVAGEPVNPLFAPWGAQISGNYSREIALASFRREAGRHPEVFADQTPVIVATRVGGRGPRTFYRVRLPAQTKQEAMRICDRLRKAGGACLALPN